MKKPKCYISYSFDPDLNKLKYLLDKLGITILNKNQDFRGQTVFEYSKEQIAKCDFLIAYVEKESESVLIDIGIAEGMSKPIYVISNFHDYPPYYLRGIRFFRTDFTGGNKLLEYQLRIFIDEIAKNNNIRIQFDQDEKELINEVEIEALIVDLKRLHKEKNGAEVERKFGLLLNKLEIQNRNARQISKDSQFDYILTSPKITEYIGSPIFVEIKSGNHSKSQIEKAVSKLHSHISKFPNAIGLFIYLNPKSIHQPKHRYFPERIFVFEMIDFVKKVKEQGFENFLINERNRIVHHNL